MKVEELRSLFHFFTIHCPCKCRKVRCICDKVWTLSCVSLYVRYVMMCKFHTFTCIKVGYMITSTDLRQALVHACHAAHKFTVELWKYG